MPMQPIHEDVRGQSVHASRPRMTPVPQPPENCEVSTDCQDLPALEMAIELIEMRYEEHCARLNLEALFADGEMGCL
jgi:hypothetical protein